MKILQQHDCCILLFTVSKYIKVARNTNYWNLCIRQITWFIVIFICTSIIWDIHLMIMTMHETWSSSSINGRKHSNILLEKISKPFLSPKWYSTKLHPSLSPPGNYIPKYFPAETCLKPWKRLWWKSNFTNKVHNRCLSEFLIYLCPITLSY